MTDNQLDNQINVQAGIQGVIGNNKGTVNQYIISTVKSDAEIHSRTLILGSPYIGLKKFETKDSNKFFGRDRQIKALSEELNKNNLLLLIGASGSGKSSLILAGLIPYLENKWGTNKLFTLTLVPTKNPFKSLYSKLPEEYEEIGENLFLEKSVSNTALVDLVESIQKESHYILIYIDQFEELFTISSKVDEAKCQQFIDCLIQLIGQNNPSVKIVMTMRSDFLGTLSHYPELATVLETHIRLIKDMTRDELRLAIGEPAARNGVTFEAGLVDRIIEEFDKKAGSLPLLQYTLDLLWEKDKEKDGLQDKSLNISSYDAIGGVKGALEQQANKIYRELSPLQQEAAKTIFLEIIDIVGEQPVSKRAELSQFQDGNILESTYQQLVKHRLLVTTIENNNDSGKNIINKNQKVTVEVSHEELLRSWKFLQELIQEKQEIIRLKSDLKSDFIRWYKANQQDQEKARQDLLIGSKLERIIELRKEPFFGTLEKDVNLYIDNSIDWRDREKRDKEEQIQKLDLALTEAILREQAAQVLNLLPTQPLPGLLLSIQTVAKNHQKLTDKMLPVVLNALYQALQTGTASLPFRGHESGVYCVAFHPSGEIIASASNDATIRLWNLQGQQIQQPFYRHQGAVQAITFSLDGDKIISGGVDGTLCLWDLQGNIIWQNIHGNSGKIFTGVQGVVCIAFGQEIIASGGSDGIVCLWNLQGEIIAEISPEEKWSTFLQKQSITSLAFNSDGSKFAIAYRNGWVQVFDLKGNRFSEPFKVDVGSPKIAFSPNREQIISGGIELVLRLWDFQGNKLAESTTPIPPGEHSINSLAFSPDGQTIISGDGYGVRLWKHRENKLIKVAEFGETSATSVAFSPSGKTIISGSFDNTLRLWHLDSRDGSKVITISGYHKKSLILSNLEDNSNKKLYITHQAPPICMSFETTRETIISADIESIYIWDFAGNLLQRRPLLMNTSEEKIQVYDNENIVEQTIIKHEFEIECGAFSHNRKILVTGCKDGIILFWDFQNGTIIKTIQAHTQDISTIVFTEDETRFASGSYDGTICLWTSEGELIGEPLQGHYEWVYSVAFSLDRQWIASSSVDGKVCLWDWQGNLIQQSIQENKGAVFCVVFSPDSQLIACGTSWGTIRLIDLDGNLIGQPFTGHEKPVYSVNFSPDGELLASASEDGTIRLWRANYWRWLEICCDRLRYHPAFTEPSQVFSDSKDLKLATTACEACQTYWGTGGKIHP
ncbi:MAG: hypothetical protein PUP90_24000 [Nostoc sp. S4]|nr:hypothetical protein [Nostoc sp. S4]